METTGKAFIEHWSWAASKGLMNKNTATALKSASMKVLSSIDGWETIDITTLDVEDTLNRFQNLIDKDLTPESLRAYKRRFRQAFHSYKDYIQNPSSWKPSALQNKIKQSMPHTSPKKQSVAQNNNAPIVNSISVGNSLLEQRLVEYPFPLREDFIISLRLPQDLRLIEVKRITAFMKMLTVDFNLEEE